MKRITVHVPDVLMAVAVVLFVVYLWSCIA